MMPSFDLEIERPPFEGYMARYFKGGGSASILHVSESMGWSKFFRQYPTVDVWCRKNPGKVAGKFLDAVDLTMPLEVVYYNRPDSRWGTVYCWVFAGSPIPEDAKVFPSYAEWMKASGG